MYLPIDRPEARQAITDAFWDYNAVCRRQLWPKYDAHQHWAKVEPPVDAAERAAPCGAGCATVSRWASWWAGPHHGPAPVTAHDSSLAQVDEFNAARRELDPKNILSNRLLDALLEAPDP